MPHGFNDADQHLTNNIRILRATAIISHHVASDIGCSLLDAKAAGLEKLYLPTIPTDSHSTFAHKRQPGKFNHF